jgi:hypothetical protein
VCAAAVAIAAKTMKLAMKVASFVTLVLGRLAKEIDSWGADVFCLQEVDAWSDVMEKVRGCLHQKIIIAEFVEQLQAPVHCVWARKGCTPGLFSKCITSPREARADAASHSPSAAGGESPAAREAERGPSAAATGDTAAYDGCLCAWHPAKFDYISHRIIALPSPSSKPGVALLTLLKPKSCLHTRFAAPSVDAEDFPPLMGARDTDSPRAARRKAAAAAAAASAASRLETNSDGGVASRPILFVTTHLVWNSKRGDIKLHQLHLIFRAIHSFCSSCSNHLPPAIVLAGDFNSTPSSAIYSLITSGRFQLHSLQCSSLPYYIRQAAILGWYLQQLSFRPAAGNSCSDDFSVAFRCPNPLHRPKIFKEKAGFVFPCMPVHKAVRARGQARFCHRLGCCKKQKEYQLPMSIWAAISMLLRPMMLGVAMMRTATIIMMVTMMTAVVVVASLFSRHHSLHQRLLYASAPSAIFLYCHGSLHHHHLVMFYTTHFRLTLHTAV